MPVNTQIAEELDLATWVSWQLAAEKCHILTIRGL
jgi:hypothetical protein